MASQDVKTINNILVGIATQATGLARFNHCYCMASTCAEHCTACWDMPRYGSATRKLYCHSYHSTSWASCGSSSLKAIWQVRTHIKCIVRQCGICLGVIVQPSHCTITVAIGQVELLWLRSISTITLLEYYLATGTKCIQNKLCSMFYIHGII